MNRILYEIRCKCKEKRLRKKKRKKKRKSTNRRRSEGKLLIYPDKLTSKTFQIKYERKLSSVGKLLLKSFQNKYLYYAIDDILYALKSNPTERDNLLTILYSPILSLQNNFSINFFEIWINEIYISERFKVNKFLITNSQNLEPFNYNYITIKFLYHTKLPVKKLESLW